MKKIRPSQRYTYLTFLIIFIALTFLLWAIVGTKSWSFEGDYIKDRLWVELTYIGISLFLCILGALIYRYRVYYLVDEERVVYHAKTITEFYYKDIVYIDDARLLKHIDTNIYLNTGKWINITLDSKKELYQLIKNKSPLLTKEEFELKYPNAKNKKCK